MKIEIVGSAVSADNNQGVFGVSVELFMLDPATNEPEQLASQITNRQGEYSFQLPVEVHQYVVEKQAQLYIRATDQSDNPVTSDLAIDTTPERVKLHSIIVPDEVISNLQLPPQPTNESVIKPPVFDTIELAISERAPNQTTYQQLSQNFFCTLPPLWEFDDILDVAVGVLRGRPEDIARFRVQLENMTLWNLKTYSGPRRSLNKEEAESLLSNDVLDDLVQRIEAARQGPIRADVISAENIAILMTAAIRVSGDDTIAIHRNLGAIAEQISGLKRLDSLYQVALNSLSGGVAEQTLFLNTLKILGGGWGPSGVPEPSPPQPIPLPEGPPYWPPDPRHPGLPIDPRDPEACTAELARAVREVLERGIDYEITSIDNVNACVGDEITITGTNFQFDGRNPVVLFAGRPRGTKIRATPSSATDSEIRVVVPIGATCGEVELEIPQGASTIIACGATFELFAGPATAFRFEGGDTKIDFFLANEFDDCLAAGEEVSFRWGTCNAENTNLAIVTSTGEVLFDDPVDGNHYRFFVPSLSENTLVTATLSASGPCGIDEASLHFSIRRGIPLDLSELFSFSAEAFENWHGNIRRSALGVARPSDVDDLVRAVLTVEQLGSKIGVEGSRWSYSDCIAPSRTRFVVNCDNLERRFGPSLLETDILEVIPIALRRNIRSVLDPDVELDFCRCTSLDEDNPVILPVRDRLVHVRAGMKIHTLNCILDLKPTPLSLATMGGNMGQTLAGAINTGTHGANPKLPPLADFVRAIHLVGPGGQQWWIESALSPVTDPDEMEKLKRNDVLDPCLKVVYDDALFSACLVSIGQAGIVVSYVVETVNAHNLRTTTEDISWSEAMRRMRASMVTSPTITDWWLEVLVTPTRRALLSRRHITRTPPPACPPPPAPGSGTGPSEFDLALLGFLFGPSAVATIPSIIGFGTGAVAGLMGALPAYVARRTIEMGFYASNPFFLPKLLEIQEELQLIERLTNTMTSLTRAISSGFRPSEVADLIPNILNVIWQIGLYVIDGKTIVETAQDIFMRVDQRPPGTIDSQKSYDAMTPQMDCMCSTAAPRAHSACERLIESYEYALPPNECIDFADTLLRFADDVRETNDALILSLNIRFTRKTRATIGMQRFPLTGYVEVYTVKGLAGNEAFHRKMLAEAVARDAIPHWGQFHDQDRDFAVLYGTSLTAWQAAMDRLAREGGGALNTFRNAFAIRRGMLREL